MYFNFWNELVSRELFLQPDGREAGGSCNSSPRWSAAAAADAAASVSSLVQILKCPESQSFGQRQEISTFLDEVRLKQAQRTIEFKTWVISAKMNTNSILSKKIIQVINSNSLCLWQCLLWGFEQNLLLN